MTEARANYEIPLKLRRLMSRDCSSTRLKFVICHICYDKLNSVFNYLRPMETVRRQSIKAAD